MDDEHHITYRISPEAEQGRTTGGSLLVEATGVVARSQIAGTENQTAEPVNRKERAQLNTQLRSLEEKDLIQWADAKGLLVSEFQFETNWINRKIGEGAEQQVYLDHSGTSVIKTNDAIMHGTWLEFFNRIAVHNWLFPEVCYQLSGFTFVNGSLAAVIGQAFVRSTAGASRTEVEGDMLQRGFYRLRNDGYYNATLGISVEDLHDENVLKGADGELFYFDPVIYLKTPEMNLQGEWSYRFPFK